MPTSTLPETLYVQIPEVTPHRVLHPSRVVEAEGRQVAIVTPEPLSLEIDTTALVYFEDRQRFVQQPARVRVTGPAPDGPGSHATLELIGDPLNAEQRQVYRVSCVGAALRATFAAESDCAVVDISATGFGVRAATAHQVGNAVTTVLYWAGEAYPGQVVVVSVRELPDGRFRYGVRCVDATNRPGATLRGSLTRVSLAVQRAQLRRLA